LLFILIPLLRRTRIPVIKVNPIIFAPIKLPTESKGVPSNAEVTPTNNSGIEVETAIIIKPTANSFSLKECVNFAKDLTHHDPENTKITQEITNSIKPDAFISVHNNALKTKSSIRGAETYFWNPQSEKLAYLVHKSILRNINIPDHYIRKARFYVIRHTPSPAVLAELGFLSNYTDRQLLTNKSTQDKYANALAEAILKFLDIEPKHQTSSQQDTKTAKETKNE